MQAHLKMWKRDPKGLSLDGRCWVWYRRASKPCDMTPAFVLVSVFVFVFVSAGQDGLGVGWESQPYDLVET